MELKCDNCGKIDYVLVDGYYFGDRLLEGVNFKVKDKDGKPNSVGVTDECIEYFEDLNKNKWLKICDDFCEDLDIAQCPKCGDDVVVWGNPIITGIKPPEPRAIPTIRGSDFVKLFRRD